MACFDPDAEPSSADKLVQQREDGESPSKEIDLGDSEKKSVTYEELREKLRRKIEALEGSRGEKRLDEKKMRNEWNKRSRDWEGEGSSREKRGNVGEGSAREKRENVGEDNDDDGDDDGEEIIEYGKVKLGDEGDGRNSKKKRKLSKAQELEILLCLSGSIFRRIRRHICRIVGQIDQGGDPQLNLIKLEEFWKIDEDIIVRQHVSCNFVSPNMKHQTYSNDAGLCGTAHIYLSQEMILAFSISRNRTRPKITNTT